METYIVCTKSQTNYKAMLLYNVIYIDFFCNSTFDE